MLNAYIAALLILKTMRPIASVYLQYYVVVVRLIGVEATVLKLIKTCKSEKCGDARRYISSPHGDYPPLGIGIEMDLFYLSSNLAPSSPHGSSFARSCPVSLLWLDPR
jgi:hypothetical protein